MKDTRRGMVESSWKRGNIVMTGPVERARRVEGW